jgi:hypothetical protein
LLLNAEIEAVCGYVADRIENAGTERRGEAQAPVSPASDQETPPPGPEGLILTDTVDRG